MATISVQGFTFYHPSASSTIRVVTDDTGTVVGIEEIVTITDTVIAPGDIGSASLTGIVRLALDTLKENEYKSVNLFGDDTFAKVQNVSVDASTDYVTRLIYTIELLVESKKVLPTSPFGINAEDNVQALTITEELEKATNRSQYLIQEKIYYNSATQFKVSINITCGGTSTKTAKENSNNVLGKVLITQAELLNDLVDGEDAYLQNIEKTSSVDGSLTANVTVLYLPNDSSEAATVNEKISQTFNRSPMKYQTRDYNIIVSSIAAATYDSKGNIISYPDHSSLAKNIGKNILESLDGTNHRVVSTLTSNLIVTKDPCPPAAGSAPLPDLPDNVCYNTREVSTSEDRSQGSYTLTLKQSTEPYNCDLDGTKIEYTIATNKEQKVYAELHGWSNDKSVLQNFNTKKADTIDFKIDVSDLSKCGSGSGLLDKAKNKLDELIVGYTGIMIAEKITLNDNLCSLTATFHVGVDSSNEDTNNRAFAGAGPE